MFLNNISKVISNCLLIVLETLSIYYRLVLYTLTLNPRDFFERTLIFQARSPADQAAYLDL